MSAAPMSGPDLRSWANAHPNSPQAVGILAILDALAEHHRQKADDRCVRDHERLYAAAGLPPADFRVGDKFSMAKNCLRFVENECVGGGWPTYVELEGEILKLKALFHEQVVRNRLLRERDDLPIERIRGYDELTGSLDAARGERDALMIRVNESTTALETAAARITELETFNAALAKRCEAQAEVLRNNAEKPPERRGMRP